MSVGSQGRFKISRRTFLTVTGAAGVGALGLDLTPTVAYASETAAAVRRTRITTTICPYCAVGCGALVTSEKKNGKSVVVNV